MDAERQPGAEADLGAFKRAGGLLADEADDARDGGDDEVGYLVGPRAAAQRPAVQREQGQRQRDHARLRQHGQAEGKQRTAAAFAIADVQPNGEQIEKTGQNVASFGEPDNGLDPQRMDGPRQRREERRDEPFAGRRRRRGFPDQILDDLEKEERKRTRAKRSSSSAMPPDFRPTA